MLKYKYIFHTEAILSNSTRKLLWFEITKMLIAVLKNKLMVLLIIIFGTLSFPVPPPRKTYDVRKHAHTDRRTMRKHNAFQSHVCDRRRHKNE